MLYIRSMLSEPELVIAESKLVSDIFSRRQKSLGKCSTCFEDLGEAVQFRIKQLRNFGRQSKRLDARNVTLGRHRVHISIIVNIIFQSISANKIGKSGDFVQSDEILRDVLFGVRKSDVTNERSIY